MKCPVVKDKNSVSYKRSLIIGTLLGDACSRRRKNNKKGGLRAELMVKHAIYQEDFVRWKSGEINRLFDANTEVKTKNYDGGIARFSLSRGKRIRVIHDWFHNGRHKVITNKIRFMDHPVGLAMLVCDDGSVRKRKKKHRDGSIYYLSPSITIATHSFSKNDVQVLLDHIEMMCGAKGYLNPERRWRNQRRAEYNRVNFNVDNSRKLWDYIKDWIPQVPSMIDKFSFAIERFQ